jgi:hypothetical protein
MASDVTIIQAAIQLGDKKAARRMLRPLLDSNPSAELWYLAACPCESADQEIGCLRRALKLDAQYAPARARYRKLKAAGELDMPSLDMLIDDMPLLDQLTEFPEPVRNRPAVDIQAIKAEKRRKKSRQWNLLGCGGSLLLSLSLSYFVLTVIGSPIPAQIRQIVSGEAPVAVNVGTPVFGRPVPTGEGVSNSGRDPLGVDGFDTAFSTPNPANGTFPTPDSNPQTYSDDAAAGGFVVQPNKTAPLSRGTPITDVLDAGFAHEYTFSANAGEEIAVAIQFFSPTAKDVNKNVAVLDGDDVNAENHCQRDQIFVDGSGAAFICTVHKSGLWKLQVFGRDGESTGVYVITYERT